jgi:hypothetical protein
LVRTLTYWRKTVNDDASRLYVPKGAATSLLRAQMVHGEQVRRDIARITEVQDFESLRSQLSRWSQHNERALVTIFGEPERLAYRSAGLPQVRVQGLDARKARMGQVVSARLAYLGDAVGRVDIAAQKQADSAADHKSWWRIMLDHPWTIAIAAPVIAAPVITVITLAVTGTGTGASMLTGSVVCVSGRPVVGVWIAASSGQDDSGFAHLGPANASGISYPAGSAATYSYRLPHSGTYSVHVGCGETASGWDSRNYSSLLSGATADLRCNDPTNPPIPGVVPEGKCIPITGS